MKLDFPIGWPLCPYESGTPMPPVLMPGEKTGRLCHREANGRQRPNRGLMAPAAALTAQSEGRPSTDDRTKGKKAGTGIPASSTRSCRLCGAVGGMTGGPRGAVARLGRGEKCRYSLSAALIKLSSEVLLRVLAPQLQGTTLLSLQALPYVFLCLFASHSCYCAHQGWFCPVLRLVNMLTNERHHVSGTLDAGEARIEDQLCYPCSCLNFRLKNV
jgi:hypothetical protein